MQSALTMSVPRRKPLSTVSACGPLPASTISGSASMVERPLSSLRAPWFETMMPSMPFCTASAASSCASIPFSTIFIFVVSRSRLRKSQVMFDDCVFVRPLISRPSYIERRFMLACRLERSWQPEHSRVSGALQPEERLLVAAAAAIHGLPATTGQPAFSARVTMAFATSHLLVA